jgi:long-chain acyl-CoA synthetase
MTLCYCDDPAKVAEVLREVRPTVMCAVPCFYEQVYATVFDRLESASPLRRRLFRWAIGVGAEMARCRREERPVSPGLRLSHAMAGHGLAPSLPHDVHHRQRDVGAPGSRTTLAPCRR